MRLIDADDAIYELERVFPVDDFKKIIRAISRTPTADAVEVVRCKDCKCDDSNPQHLPCTGWYPPDDFFCAYGKRSE